MRSALRTFKGNSLWLSWIFVGALALLCGLLAIVQSRWIDQIGNAQRQRLQINMQNGLNRLSTAFDSQVTTSAAELVPLFSDLDSGETTEVVARQYAIWKVSHEAMFRRVGIVNNNASPSEFSLLDLNTGAFAPAAWPDDWKDRQHPSGNVIQIPLFGTMRHRSDDEERRGPPPGGRFGDDGPGPFGPPPEPFQEDSLMLELDPAYLSEKMLPNLIARYLEEADSSRYDAKIVSASDPSITIAKVDGDTNFSEPDGSAALLDPAHLRISNQRERRGPEPRYIGSSSQPRWRLLVRRRNSMDNTISALRWRNFAVSGGILLLILTMVTVLVHYSRRANQLAQMQMNFVAGVSHDLRTPLTVIRTAAYNLRGRIATRPEQVEKYGQLIQTESEKLSQLVEQVLRYNAAKAGRLISGTKILSIAPLVESSLASSLSVPAGQGAKLEMSIPDGLPPVSGDELALKHALQNLFDNAVKYGLEGGNWIGVSVRSATEEAKEFVEIRIADRGPGIPVKEQGRIFDAFVRGERALQDHVQGTGLGLNLVKRIVEAHGGDIRLVSEPGKGTEFIFRLPAATAEEFKDEFANTAG